MAAGGDPAHQLRLIRRPIRGIQRLSPRRAERLARGIDGVQDEHPRVVVVTRTQHARSRAGAIVRERFEDGPHLHLDGLGRDEGAFACRVRSSPILRLDVSVSQHSGVRLAHRRQTVRLKRPGSATRTARPRSERNALAGTTEAPAGTSRSSASIASSAS